MAAARIFRCNVDRASAPAGHSCHWRTDESSANGTDLHVLSAEAGFRTHQSDRWFQAAVLYSARRRVDQNADQDGVAGCNAFFFHYRISADVRASLASQSEQIRCFPAEGSGHRQQSDNEKIER